MAQLVRAPTGWARRLGPCLVSPVQSQAGSLQSLSLISILIHKVLHVGNSENTCIQSLYKKLALPYRIVTS